MRLGPGKHLKGRFLMGGIVKPEEFDYFHEVFTFSVISTCFRSLCASPQMIINTELARFGTRGAVDGKVIT